MRMPNVCSLKKRARTAQSVPGSEEFIDALLEQRFGDQTEHPALRVMHAAAREALCADAARKLPITELPIDTPLRQLNEAGGGEGVSPLATMQLLLKDIKVPSLPQVLMELLNLINSPRSTAEDLAEVISLDPSLSSAMLRLVNSAKHSFSYRIESIHRAVVIIGVKELSALAISRSFMSMFRSSGGNSEYMKRFWRHSVGCAIVATEMAQIMGEANIARYYTAGLLHDIGRLALYANLDGCAATVERIGRLEHKPWSVVEAEKMSFDHATFGAALMHKWQLPTVLIDMVRHHHEPHKARSGFGAEVLHLADVATTALGHSADAYARLPRFDSQVWSTLALTPTELIAVLRQAALSCERSFRILFGVREFWAA